MTSQRFDDITQVDVALGGRTQLQPGHPPEEALLSEDTCQTPALCLTWTLINHTQGLPESDLTTAQLGPAIQDQTRTKPGLEPATKQGPNQDLTSSKSGLNRLNRD